MKKEKILKKRVKTPTVLQMEAVECGAAALAIILSYYGRIVPLEKLRIDCGVSRDGSKAVNILKAARKYGLIAKVFKAPGADLLLSLNFPMIVFWNFNHFLVVEGFGKNCVYLNDPASGPGTVSKEEFSRSFTGIVLTFEPGPDFKKEGVKPGLYGNLIHRLKGSETALIYILLAGLLLVFPGLIIPMFMKIFVDNILINRMENIIAPLITGIIITAILQGGLTYLQQYYILRFETKLSLSTSSKFFWHVLRLPVEFFTQRFAGDISSRIAINDKISQLLSHQITPNILNILMCIFYLIILFTYNTFLTLMGLFIVFLNVLALKYIARKRIDGNMRVLQERGKLLGTSMAGLSYIETIKSSGTEGDFYTRWAGYFAKTINIEQELNVYTQFLAVIPSFLNSLNTMVILSVGTYLIIKGHMTAGTLVAYQSLMGCFMTPFNRLVNMGSTIQEVQGDMDRLDDILRYDINTGKETFKDRDNTIKLSGKLEIKDITFGYSPLEPPLIEDFNLTLLPGSRVAIVGSSGSGKSTIGKLICSLYHPWKGEILFDGKPAEKIPVRIINNTLAMVDQSIMLFEGTVRENISLWDLSIEKTDIIRAAKDASIHDAITEKEKGYDCIVEEDGRNFSGGQRQRLEIARALSTNPRILVLDEATSALDAITEKMIDENLRKRGCTCVIIAHRLSTIKDCDEIIVLDKGRVVQRGRHDELIKEENSLYRSLVQIY
jgi:NHLM bacteriocin system ABC transporter peptidase/ATP-binding protein